MQLSKTIFKTKRTIDVLREQFPGKWTYNRKAKEYIGPGTKRARWLAACTPRYDGDDDTFTSELYLYEEGHSPIRVYFSTSFTKGLFTGRFI